MRTITISDQQIFCKPNWDISLEYAYDYDSASIKVDDYFQRQCSRYFTSHTVCLEIYQPQYTHVWAFLKINMQSMFKLIFGREATKVIFKYYNVQLARFEPTTFALQVQHSVAKNKTSGRRAKCIDVVFPTVTSP